MSKTLQEEVLSHLAHRSGKGNVFVGVEVFYYQFHHHGPDAVMHAILALRREGKITTAGSHLSPDAIALVGKATDLEDE